MIKKEHPICEGIEWLDVTDPTTPEMQELADRYHLNPYIVRDCMEPDHLPKYDLVDDVNFLILRYYAHNFNHQAATIQDLTNKIAIFYTDRFLITIHKTEVAFMDLVNKRHVATGRYNSRCRGLGAGADVLHPKTAVEEPGMYRHLLIAERDVGHG